MNIKFKGWIKKQLIIQANGLFGSLDKIWPDVKDSKWIGGTSDGWERFPYYLNGLVPLAYTLNDKLLIKKAKSYIDKIILLQSDDGNILPSNIDDNLKKDIWPLFLLLKVFSIYGNLSKDYSINEVIMKALKYIDNHIEKKPLADWAKYRYFECYIPMLYIKQNTNDKSIHEFIKRLAIKLKQQGTNYSKISKSWNKTSSNWGLDTHGVNIAMALKSNELYELLTGIKDKFNSKKMLEILDKYHSTAYYHFSCDECLSGTSSYAGVELCSIVEAMYSYEILFKLTNDTFFLNRLEKLAFNALPATFLDNMNAHQYDQQVNQIACLPFEKKQVFKTNKNEANVFGLEPNFGCCTANFGQGFPLFALSAFSIKEDILQINIPLSAKIKLNDGTIIECVSDYPFNNKVELIANKDCIVKLRNYNFTNSDDNQDFIIFNLKKNIKTKYKYVIKPKLINRNNNLFVLYYGNLLFSLPIDYKMEYYEYSKDNVNRVYPYCDYYFIPTGKFKYAFNSLEFKVVKCKYNIPFDRLNPPIKIYSNFINVDLRLKKDYQYVYNDNPHNIYNKVDKLYMVPYGNTYLRMTEMSFYNKKNS